MAEQKKVLVIDDTSYVVELIKDHLEMGGYIVETAFSGAEGVKKAKEFNPDIITLDIMMPEMNGFQVAEILKKTEITKNIPIIFVSVVAEAQKDRGKAVGVNIFVTKPIDFKRLKEIISRTDTEDKDISMAGEDSLKKLDSKGY